MSPKISCQQSTHTRNQISNESIFSNQRFNNLALLIKVVRVQVVNATVPYRWTEHDAIYLLVIKIQFKGSDEQSSDSSSSIRKYNLPSPIWYWRAPRPAPPLCLRRDGDLVIDALVLENMAKKTSKIEFWDALVCPMSSITVLFTNGFYSISCQTRAS